MGIKKVEIRPRTASGTYDDVLYPKTSTDMVEGLSEVMDTKVDKVSGKQLSTNDYTTVEKNKLANIEEGANKYVHPSTHSATMITEDSAHRFVTDIEKIAWNSKETPSGAQTKANQALTDAKLYTDANISKLVTNVEPSMKYNTLEVYKQDGSMKEIILNIKGGDGVVNNVFRTGGTWGEFVATTTTNTFTIPNMDNTKEVFLTYKGSFLVENKNFIIDKSTGVVTLGFNLEAKEYIDYEVVSTSFNYYDLINTPPIKNNLLETSTGSVLDARQGKVLNDKINTLSTNSLQYKGAINTNLDDYKQAGVYRVVDATIPTELKGKFSGYGVYTVQTGLGYIGRTLLDTANNKMFYSTIRESGVINKWEEIATSTNLDTKLNNTSITLTRIESTVDQAIYTCPIDLELNKIYTFGTGGSPSGNVKKMILRCNLGDFTFKIANTNIVDTMKDASWGDFNAGQKVDVFLVQTETTKGVVIRNATYSTGHFALAESLNGFQIYKSVTELGLESTATWAEIATAMKVNSILITQECGDVKPTSWGTVTVKKSINNNRVEFMWTESVKGSSPTRTYIAHHHTDGGFSGWYLLTTTKSIEVLTNQISELEIQMMERGLM